MPICAWQVGDRTICGAMQVVAGSHVALAVAQEVLRLDPTARVTFRKALQDTAIAGTPVPAKTMVMLS